MQQNQNTIHIYDVRGEIIGSITLPASIKLIDLAPLKILGAVSVKVVACSTPFAGVSAGGVQ
ncbi:hypothetical protein [Pseudomonas viridiflava]|uniref:hypothetical protein n=1 Tax=Pseudomonas viridiflava TaxID=33069 RepID=UPI001C318E51|nr:hypothetical protein [Pseudomonas viridiflava]QXG29089.1 hypothetical protein KTT59_19120 [Pseudomonas viridiflava]